MKPYLNKIILVTILAFLCLQKNYSQCNIKINNRSDGTTVRYLNPELVGIGTNCQLGLSIQTNGIDYFLTTTVRYFSPYKKIIGSLKIQLSNNNSLDIPLYTSELATIKNEDVALSIFTLSEADVINMKKANIKTIIFKEDDDNNQIIIVDRNYDVLKRHIKCLQQ